MQAITQVEAGPLKRCTRCGEGKPATRDHFSPKKVASDGLQVWCKPCCAAQKRASREANPGRNSAARRRYQAAHADEVNAKRRLHYQANREAQRAVQADYWSRTKDERNARRRRLNADSPEYRAGRLASQQRWKDKDPEHARRVRAEWWAKRTPVQKLRTVMSNAVRDSLKGRRKGAGWQGLLGYTADDLRAHIERQFLLGMSWENHGPVWHIDHVVPVASFDIQSAECPEFRACWAITNLRPLWAGENLSKRAQRTLLL